MSRERSRRFEERSLAENPMTGRRIQKPSPLGEVLESFFTRAGMKPRLAEQRILDAWEKAVGRGVADQTEPLRIQNGVLWVRVSHSGWMQQLHFLKATILERIREETEADTLKDLRLVIGDVSGRGAEATREFSGGDPPAPTGDAATEIEKERIRREVVGLADPEMREIFARVFSLGLGAAKTDRPGRRKEEK